MTIHILKSKLPQTMMVSECVSYEDAIHHHIFEQGLRLNSDGYVVFLNTVIKPWLERPYV